MSDQVALKQVDPAPFFAEISAAYIEVLAGVRRPEQLARWLTDRTYYDVCQRAQREARQRAVTGLRSRPEVSLRCTQTFLTDHHAYQGVVILRISGATKAVSIRAELINARYRITDISLI
ncbi:MAG: hypothetical protein EBS38_07395 [Actinobacteria bacterium]|nr:hypothetical protein [Actinomycetota bacterium]